MTSSVIQITNQSGGFVLSSDGFGLNYLGKAGFVQDEPAPDQNGLYAAGGGVSHSTYKRYRITTSSPFVVPFLELTTRCCGIAAMSNSGTNWDFVVFNQDGSNAIAPINIWCFGRPTTQSDYGLWTYQADGTTLGYELGQNRPLMFRAIVDLAAGVNSGTIPSGFTTPAIMGYSTGYVDPAWVLVSAPLGQWRANAFVNGWSRSGTTIVRSQRQYRVGDIYEFAVGESPANEDYTGQAVTAFIIEANGLT